MLPSEAKFLFFSMAMVVVLIYTFISSGVEGRGLWGKEEFSSFYYCYFRVNVKDGLQVEKETIV